MDTNLTEEQREALKREYGLSDEELNASIVQAESEDDVPEGGTDIPKPPRKDDILLFLRDVLEIKSEDNLKINRTGNLSDAELGRLVLNARSYNNIANYAATEGYDKVQDYLYSKTSNIITTSTSKKGFFLQLIISMKKVNKNIGQKQTSKQSSLFGGSKEVVVGGEEE